MLGFDGFTITDFLKRVRSAVKATNAGLDIGMPCRLHYVADLEKAVGNGEVDEETIDESLRHVLRTAHGVASKRSGRREAAGDLQSVSVSLR